MFISTSALAQLVLVPIEPVAVHFGPGRVVITNGGVGLQAAEICIKSIRRDFVLDTKFRGSNGTNWCRRVSSQFYTDEFRVATVGLTEVETLRHVSERQLSRLFGDPVFAEGPLMKSSIVYKWRACNGKTGDEFRAVQVVAGFNDATATNVLFLVVCNASNR